MKRVSVSAVEFLVELAPLPRLISWGEDPIAPTSRHPPLPFILAVSHIPHGSTPPAVERLPLSIPGAFLSLAFPLLTESIFGFRRSVWLWACGPRLVALRCRLTPSRLPFVTMAFLVLYVLTPVLPAFLRLLSPRAMHRGAAVSLQGSKSCGASSPIFFTLLFSAGHSLSLRIVLCRIVLRPCDGVLPPHFFFSRSFPSVVFFAFIQRCA